MPLQLPSVRPDTGLWAEKPHPRLLLQRVPGTRAQSTPHVSCPERLTGHVPPGPAPLSAGAGSAPQERPLTWLAKSRWHTVWSSGSFMMARITCSIGVMPAKRQPPRLGEPLLHTGQVPRRCPGRCQDLGQLTAAHSCAPSHTLTPCTASTRWGLREGVRDHAPVPPAIMPTDVTVLMTGLDFLSGRMANFPGERRRGEARSPTRYVWGSDGRWDTGPT